MCDPVSITMAAVGIASSVASAAGQNRTANETFKAATQSATDDAYALNERRGEEGRANSDKMSARAREGEAQMGSLNALLADTNLSGSTADKLANEVSMGTAEDLTTMARDPSLIGSQLSREGASSRARAQSAVNGAPRASLIGTGLQIAGTSLSAYNHYKAGSLAGGGR